jgi:hypothetical protein
MQKVAAGFGSVHTTFAACTTKSMRYLGTCDEIAKLKVPDKEPCESHEADTAKLQTLSGLRESHHAIAPQYGTGADLDLPPHAVAPCGFQLPAYAELLRLRR